MTKTKNQVDRVDQLHAQIEVERVEVVAKINEMATIRERARTMGGDWNAAIRVAAKLGLSNAEIARASGLSAVRVSQIIHGQKSGQQKRAGVEA